MRNEEQNFEEKISGLLGALKRIEAPRDFDFKVRARIAKGRPAAARVSWLPASVKVAVPLGLMLSVGGYFGFNALYSIDNSIGPAVAVAPVTEPQLMPFVPVTDDPIALPASPTAEVAQVATVEVSQARPVSKPVTPSVRKISTVRRTPEAEGGSVDSAAPVTKSIFPVGVTPNANIAVPASPGESAPVRIAGKDVLDRIGVSAVRAAGGWLVQFVNAAGSAGKAGVQAGDLIEAVNGSTLSDKAVIETRFSAKGLRIRRDGRIVFIGLIP
jgi:hypothetical protein